MSSAERTVEGYLAELPQERREAIAAVRTAVKRALPRGYVEGMQYGMIAWSVPLARYPDTHNGQPLAVASLASQKGHMSLYLTGCYAAPKERAWFEAAWKKAGKKLDMGQSCVRFRGLADVDLGVIGQAIARLGVDDLIAAYEASRPTKKRPAPKPAKPAAKKAPKRSA